MTRPHTGMLQRNPRLKLIANHTYLYGIQLFHILMELLPFFFRNPIFSLVIGKLGRGSYIDYKCYFKFPWLVEIGRDCSINRGVEFYSEYFGPHKIHIGNNVRVAPNVKFHAGGHDTSDLEYRHSGGNITVRDDTWIGAGAIILPGVTIGRGCIVGAGSVVTSDIEDFTLAAGIPARMLRKRTELTTRKVENDCVD